MPYTETSICNKALMKIGERRIQTITDPGSSAARACKALYDDLRDEVLTMHEWQFAKARKTLTKLATDPTFGYSYAYQIPSDCLRPLRLENRLTLGVEPPWETEGDQLFCDIEEDAQLHYIKREESPVKFSAMFVEALALRMSSPLAITLKKDKALSKDQYQLFLNYLTTLQSIDSRSENQDLDGMDSSLSSFVRARGD